MGGNAGWREPLPGSGVTCGVTEVVASGPRRRRVPYAQRGEEAFMPRRLALGSALLGHEAGCRTRCRKYTKPARP